MNRHFTRFLFFSFCITIFLASCEDTPSARYQVEGHEDAVIGKTIDEQILDYVNLSNNIEYLQPDSFIAAYSYLRNIKNRIVNSNNLIAVAGTETNVDCPVQLRIFDRAYSSHAFIAPGGYIYLYKELLQGLQTEAQLTAVLSHLILSSRNRVSIPKLQERFSNSFVIDLADGGNLEVDINLVLQELKEVAYDSSLVNVVDVETENTICELGYDIKSYSDMFNHNQSKNLHWYQLFPRNQNSYASYLFNTVKNYPQCIDKEIDGSVEYQSFKSSLN